MDGQTLGEENKDGKADAWNKESINHVSTFYFMCL